VAGARKLLARPRQAGFVAINRGNQRAGAREIDGNGAADAAAPASDDADAPSEASRVLFSHGHASFFGFLLRKLRIDLTISFGMRAPHRPGPHGRHGKHGIAIAMPRAKASLARRGLRLQPPTSAIVGDRHARFAAEKGKARSDPTH
jgi:hypothetical protein